MKQSVMVLFTCTLCLSAPASDQEFEKQTHWNASREQNIFKYADLSQTDGTRLVGWDDLSAFDSGHAACETNQNGHTFVRLKGDSNKKVSFSTTIDLPVNQKYVTFVVRLCGSNQGARTRGNEQAGVTFSLIHEGGDQRTFPRIEPRSGGVRAWEGRRVTAAVRPGETKLRIDVNATGPQGELLLDWIDVIPSKPGFVPTKEQNDALKKAIARDDDFAIAVLAGTAPEMVHVRTGYFYNFAPVTLAAISDAPAATKELLRHGADLESQSDGWYNTPLRWACWHGCAKSAKVLIEAGASREGAERLARWSRDNSPYGRRRDDAYKEIIELLSQTVVSAESP